MLTHYSFIQKHSLSTCYREDTWLTPGGWQYTVVPFMRLNQSLSLVESVCQLFLYRSPPLYFHCHHCANRPLITSPLIIAIGPFQHPRLQCIHQAHLPSTCLQAAACMIFLTCKIQSGSSLFKIPHKFPWLTYKIKPQVPFMVYKAAVIWSPLPAQPKWRQKGTRTLKQSVFLNSNPMSDTCWVQIHRNGPRGMVWRWGLWGLRATEIS